jgi:hypothetical protein
VSDQPNPDPELFTTFERLATCHRVEVTEDNIHQLARFFGCSVDYSGDVPVLREPSNHPVKVGDWLDWRGSRWNPEPLTQGWAPEGTYHPAPTLTGAGTTGDAGERADGES